MDKEKELAQKNLAMRLALGENMNLEEEQEVTERERMVQRDRKQLLATKRKITVLGLGDGGSKVASDIKDAIDSITTISYNTSERNTAGFNIDHNMMVQSLDGTGKDRNYARKELTESHERTLVSYAKESKPDIAVVTQTTGGGTGCGTGPRMTSTYADELENSTVIGLGIYPVLEDGVSAYNTIKWQEDMLKAEVPYMIFNNNRFSGKATAFVHREVNREIIQAMRILRGEHFEASDIRSMDSKDFMKLISEIGRLNVYYTTMMPPVGQSFDDFLLEMISSSCQEPPVAPKRIGLLLKGPETMINSIDASLSKLRSIYGEFMARYEHVEYGQDVEICLITSGSDIPKEALDRLHSKYQEVIYAEKNRKKATMDYEMEDPFGTPTRRKTNRDL